MRHAIRHAATGIMLLGIGLYRLISPSLLPSSCRFFPSCSRYAEQAIKKHGPVRGILLSLGRLVRCHPWNPGGYDPVP